MAESETQQNGAGVDVPTHLWLAGILALLWNAMGVFDYLATQMQWEFYMGQFTQAQLDYFYGFPAWVVAAWAVAVWTGLGGAVGLLMRRAWAGWAFALSLAGMAVTTLYTFGLSDGASVMGTSGVMFSIVIAVVAVFLYVYARRMTRRGVLT